MAEYRHKSLAVRRALLLTVGPVLIGSDFVENAWHHGVEKSAGWAANSIAACFSIFKGDPAEVSTEIFNRANEDHRSSFRNNFRN